MKSLKRSNNGLQIFFMLLPLLVLFSMFCLYPLLYSVYYSFTSYDGIMPATFVGIGNYVRMLGDTTWWGTVLNTFQFTVMAYIIQVPISLFLAVLVNNNSKISSFFRTIFFLPNVTSTAIIGIIFFFMFSSYNGIVNGVLQTSGAISRPIEWLANPALAKWIIILLNSWSNVGFFMTLFLSAIQKIPLELYESATLDGAGRSAQFWRITLPLIGNMFPVITMMVILNAFQLFDSVKVLTGGGPGSSTSVMALYIYNLFFNSTGAQQGYASALSVAATAITAFVGFLYYAITNRQFGKND